MPLQPQTHQNRQVLLNRPTNEILGIDRGNVISGGTNNSIIGGVGSTITIHPSIGLYPDSSSIVAASYSTIYGSSNSTVVGGYNNHVWAPAASNGSHSVILGGNNNVISATDVGFNSIVGGQGNTVTGLTAWSAIVGGYANRIDVESSQTVIAGGKNHIAQTASGASFFGGGWTNTMTNAERCAIIAGKDNIILNMDDAVMIGCTGRTATAAQTTHVDKLAIMNIPTSAAGLAAGTVWRSGTALNIVL
jgi:hypothetical protein